MFGYPGDFTTAAGTAYSKVATPALPAFINGLTNSQLLLSIGRVDAVSVRIYDSSNAEDAIPTGATAEMTVDHVTDLVGQTVAVATDFPPGPVAPTDLAADYGRAYYASWRPASGGSWGGGVTAGGVIRKLTDVLLWALSHSGRNVDLEAQAGERDRLDVFLVDGYINERLDTVEWVEDHLQPLFPFIRVYSPRGMFWRAVNWNASIVDAIAHLQEGVHLARASAIRTVSDQIANRFTLEYAHTLYPDTYAARRIASGRKLQAIRGPELVDERVLMPPDAVRSDTKYGERERAAIQTGMVWHNGTAARILEAWVRRDAFPRRFVSYVGPNVARFVRGDILTITDEDLALERAVALVDAVTLSADRLQQLDIEILDITYRSTA